MKVAIYRSQLLPVSQTFIRDQARSLRRFQPIFVGRSRSEPSLSLAGFDVRLVPRRRGLAGRLERFATFRARFPQREAIEALAQSQAALVHAHFGTDAVDAWPSVRSAGLPMLVTLHGYDINMSREWWEAGREGARRRAYPAELLALAREPRIGFLAVSDAIRRRAMEFGLPANKVAVHHIGVDLQRFAMAPRRPSDRPARILFVGRMVEKKSPLELVQVFARVHATIPDAELVMVGDGPLLEDARRLVAQLGLPARLPGALGSDEIIALLHESRVFCLPSRTAKSGDAEGLPISILEAQACGVPVVSSARGGVEEGLDQGRAGIVVTEGDADALCHALVGVLSDAALADELSLRGRANAVARFDLAACTAVLEQHYADAIGRAAHPRRE